MKMILASLCFSIATVFLSLSFPVSAQSTSGIPYGGPITASITCTCSGNILVYVFDYRTSTALPLIYQPGISRLYSNFRVSAVGQYHLGTYTPGGPQCQIYSGTSCTTINSQGYIDMLPGTGTS
jgi:hypothetical protein